MDTLYSWYTPQEPSMSYLTRKLKTAATKYRNRYGKWLGITLVVLVVVSLPVPLPGVCLGVQGVGEILRLCGVRF